MHQKAGGGGMKKKKKSRLLEKPEPDVYVKSGNITTLLLVTFEQSGIVSGRPDEAGGRDGNNNISMYTNWHPSHGSECSAAGGRLSLSMCGIYIYPGPQNTPRGGGGERGRANLEARAAMQMKQLCMRPTAAADG